MMSRSEFRTMLALAACFRFACYVTSHAPEDLRFQLFSSHFEAVHIANSLLAGNGFSGALARYPKIPTAWCPPGYVLLLSGLTWMSGNSRWVLIASLLVINCLVNGLATAWTARIGWSLGGRTVGRLAFALHLLSPTVLRNGFIAWDTPFGNLAVVLLIRTAVLRRGRPSTRDDVLDGARLCLAGMISGPALYVGPAMILSRFLRGAGLARSLLSSLTVIAAFSACQLPWAVRNYLALGSPVLARSTYAMALHLANKPGGELSIPVVLGAEPEEAIYARLGEVGFREYCRESFRRDLRAYPRDYAIRSAYRLFQLWLGRVGASCVGHALGRWIGTDRIDLRDPANVIPRQVHAVVPELYALAASILAACGLIRMARGRLWREAILFASLLVFWTAVYVPAHVEERFRVPAESILSVLAAYGLASPRHGPGPGKARPRTPDVGRLAEKARDFFRPRASAWPDVWRSLVVALGASAVLTPFLGITSTVIDRSPATWHFLLDTSLCVGLLTFAADLIRRFAGGRKRVGSGPRGRGLGSPT